MCVCEAERRVLLSERGDGGIFLVFRQNSDLTNVFFLPSFTWLLPGSVTRHNWRVSKTACRSAVPLSSTKWPYSHQWRRQKLYFGWASTKVGGPSFPRKKDL